MIDKGDTDYSIVKNTNQYIYPKYAMQELKIAIIDHIGRIRSGEKVMIAINLF